MKAVVIMGIVVAVAGGIFFYSAVLQPVQRGEDIVPVPVTEPVIETEPELAPEPEPEPTIPSPPSVDTNGKGKVLESEVVTVEPSEQELTLPDLFQKVENSVVQITTVSDDFFFGGGLGSGFVHDINGHIITNNHVVEGANKISVTFPDGTVYRADLVGTDPYTDLAVIRVDLPEEKLEPLPLGDSSTLLVGEQVAAIGNPFGLSGSMTTGIVSQVGRLLEIPGARGFSIPEVIQTDAAINPGNSGGPLLNMRGEVIGVNSAIQSVTGEFSGVGFAIPADTVKKIVPILIDEGTYKHPWLGVSGSDLVPEIAEELGLEEARGFLVVDIIAGSPADKYDIRGGTKQTIIDDRQIRLGGDVIVGVDDLQVRKIDDILVYMQREKSVGDEMTLHIIREGEPMDLTVVLDERPSLFESP